MSADNFLGIYRVNKRKFVARGCWSECERNDCPTCSNRIVWIAKSLREAVQLAEETSGEYEYGYSFLNL